MFVLIHESVEGDQRGLSRLCLVVEGLGRHYKRHDSGIKQRL
jgi:hypothetical protein